jgi:LysM repeat protein
MTNINTLNSTTHNRSRRPSKLKRIGQTTLVAAGLAGSLVAFKEAADSYDPFATDIPVPTKTEPHADYTVRSGDTESEIAARFGHANDSDYMNMLNNQLPKSDQHLRTLRPGEKLRLP